MTAKYNQKKRLLTVICKVVLATRDVTMTPSINVLKDSTATDCGKMCAHATVLQGMFKFGGIELFGRSLEEHLGAMSNDAVAGLYAEHEMAADSDTEFTAPNHPAAGTTTPRQEFRVVVGKHGVDTEKWSLNPTAEPTCGADARVPGRVVRPIAHYMRCEQVRRATLTQGEVIALRLFTGPMSAKYNKVLRETTLRESAAQADAGLEAQVAVEGTTDLEVNTYSTTIGLIISGILKLGRIATAPRRNSQGTALAYRGLDGLDLPPALSTPDEQGFCGGVETAFLSLSDDEAVADAYSGVAQGKVATIFELELSKGSLGAEVAWLSQFPKDQERLLPPWTHLQVVGPPKRRADGATVFRMRPTVFQNVRTVEEVAGARKEEIRAHIAGLVMDVRSQADFDWDDAMSQRPSEQTPLLHSLIQRLAFAHRLAAFEQDLLARSCKYEAQWYDDNGKYKSTFLGVLREVNDARVPLADPASALSKRLASTDGSSAAGSASGLPELSVGAKVEIHSLVRAPDLNGAKGEIVQPQDQGTGRWVVKVGEEGRVVKLKPSNLRCITSARVDASSGNEVLARLSATAPQGDAPASSSSGAVYRLHTKFFQDPTLFQDQSKSFRAKFGSDDDFAGGMQGKLGKMDLEFVKRMYLEHNRAHDAQTEFAYGNKGKTSTAQREWRFVVGSHGVSVHTWTFDVERAEPEYTPEDLVAGRNAKPLRELMRLPRVKEAGLRVAEVVGLRLYSGPLFAAYNRVQRGFAKDGDTLYTTTAHLIKSGIFKLAMITAPPADLTLYRGTGNMALGPDFFKRDAQGFAGGVELGFMSATASRQVALEFAGMEAEEGKDATKQLPTLYVIDVGKMSIGANIADISQFEGEEEFVYPMLTRLELTKEPELSPDRKVSLIHLKLTVNQRSTTVEDAEQARRRFLTRLAHSLQWSLRNWARQRAGLTERLRPQIVGVLRRLLDEVRGAELAVLNTNEGYGQVFERIMRIWEEALRQEVVEALWQDGEQQADKVDQANAGCAEAAVRRFDQAIDAARELCADSKEVRDRVVEMGRVKMLLTGGGKDQKKDADAKLDLANDLQ